MSLENSQVSEDEQVERTLGEEVGVTGECNHSSRGYAGRTWRGEGAGSCVQLGDVNIGDNG